MMLSKISRYRKSQNVVVPDAAGRMLTSKEVRLLPRVAGTYQHTIEESDRLDHLAYKYYTQSRKWWRICDANPEFLSPSVLLGKESIVTTRFPSAGYVAGDEPYWAPLVKSLSELPGVISVTITIEMRLTQETVYKLTEESFGNLRSEGIPEDILTVLESERDRIVVGKGKFLNILSAILGVQYIDEYRSLILRYAVVKDPEDSEKDAIACAEWFNPSIVVVHNRMNIDAEALLNLLEESGIEVGQPENIGRIGKKIVIPPDTVG